MGKLVASLVLIFSLMANVVLGCATMPSLSHSQIAAISMTDCGHAMAPKSPTNKQTRANSGVCKTFCANLSLPTIFSQISVPQIYEVRTHATPISVSWDSSVDPPHPRHAQFRDSV